MLLRGLFVGRGLPVGANVGYGVAVGVQVRVGPYVGFGESPLLQEEFGFLICFLDIPALL